MLIIKSESSSISSKSCNLHRRFYPFFLEYILQNGTVLTTCLISQRTIIFRMKFKDIRILSQQPH